MPTFIGDNGGVASTEVGGFKRFDDEPEYLYSTMLFQQATAPVGWIKDTDPANDNTALVLTNKTSGFNKPTATGNPFSTELAPTGAVPYTFPISGSTGQTTVTTAMLPSHTHLMGGRDSPPGGVTYFANFKQPNSSTTAWTFAPSYTGASPTGGSSNSAGVATGTLGHSHGIAAINAPFSFPDMAFGVKYVDAIMATRY